jgi:rhodanese-related sulfurtransferase
MFQTIDAAGLSAMLGEQTPPQLVDVRTQAEVARGVIAGARHIELATLPARLAELDPEMPCVIYCLSGARSVQACTFLTQRGYARLYHLQGGIAAWVRAGLPLTA